MNAETLKPLARFRVYGWKSSLYFLVFVWPTREAMLAYERRTNKYVQDDHDAHVQPIDRVRVYKDRPSRLMPYLGEIHLHKAKLGAGLISHECFHATTALLRRKRFDFSHLNESTFSMEREEQAAHTQGEFARQITVQLIKRKL